MPSQTLNDIDLAEANRELAAKSPQERILWTREVFGEGLVMSSSFGLQSSVLLHLANETVPEIPVIFVDTGYLFKETYLYAEQVTKQLDLNLKVYSSPVTPARFEALHGKPWDRPFIELQNKVYKIYPILDWDYTKVLTWMLKHDLPFHPLAREGYVALGDTHSTKMLEDGMSAEDTRYDGLKWECGLHEGGHGSNYMI